MFLEKIMSNPYAQALLGLCTIGALLFAIYVWIKGKRKKEISVYRSCYELVNFGRSNLNAVKLLYKGHEISDLAITKFAIWNSGNEVINWSDVVEKRPLEIKSKEEHTDILDVNIITESEDTNSFEIAAHEMHCMGIKFDYIEPNDGVVVQVLHTGSTDHVNVDGKIKGGKEIKFVNKKKTKRFSKKLTVTLMVIEVILFVIASSITLLAQWGVIPETIVTKQPGLIGDIILSIVIVAGVIVVIKMMIGIFKKMYYIEVPYKLRTVMNMDEFR